MTDTTDSGKPLLQNGREVKLGGGEAGVFIQDQDSPPFQYFLMNEQKDDIALTAPVAVGDTTIDVSAGHGFTAGGEYMVIREGSFYTQSNVTGVAGDAITIRTPVSNAYTVAGAQVVRGDIEMNINGTGTSYVYEMPMWGKTPIDIQDVRITMQHPGDGDDSTFGDIAALTNGLLIRKVDDLLTQGLGNYRQNQDFREFGAEVEYTAKAGGGNFSTNITFLIKDIYGIVLRVDPRLNSVFSATVQDDLSALLRLRMSLMGQFTVGE